MVDEEAAIDALEMDGGGDNVDGENGDEKGIVVDEVCGENTELVCFEVACDAENASLDEIRETAEATVTGTTGAAAAGAVGATAIEDAGVTATEDAGVTATGADGATATGAAGAPAIGDAGAAATGAVEATAAEAALILNRPE